MAACLSALVKFSCRGAIDLLMRRIDRHRRGRDGGFPRQLRNNACYTEKLMNLFIINLHRTSHATSVVG